MHTSPKSTGVASPSGTSARSSVGDGVEALPPVRLEHLFVDDPGQERVVDAEHHVALGVAGGEHGLGHHRPGVAGDDELDVDAGLLRERGEGRR